MDPLSSPNVEINTIEEYRNVLHTLAGTPELSREVQVLRLLGVQLEGTDSSIESFVDNQSILATSFESLLPSLINLVEFKFETHLEIRPGMITGLQALPSLRKLHLDLGQHLNYYVTIGSSGYPIDESQIPSMMAILAPDSESHFQNLTSLALLNICGDTLKTRKSLVQTLLHCPNLTTLELGMSCDALEPTHLVEYNWNFDITTDIFSHLLRSNEGHPVFNHLEKLSLYDGFDLCFEGENHPLYSAIDLSKLKIFRYENDAVGESTQYPAECYDMFIKHAVNLEEFTTTLFTVEVFRFLEERKSIKLFNFSEEEVDLSENEVSSERFWNLINPPRSIKIVVDACEHDCEGDCGEWHVEAWLQSRGNHTSSGGIDQDDDGDE